MTLALRYPIYVIANQEGVLVVKVDDEECVLLFHDRELAQRHIYANPGIATGATLRPLAVPDAESFEEGLRGLPANVTCAVWDAGAQRGFIHIGVDELLLALTG